MFSSTNRYTKRLFVFSAVLFLFLMTFSLSNLAQTRVISHVATPASQMKAVCGTREVVEKKVRGSKTTYSCSTKPKRASASTSSSASMSIKAADDGGLRAEVNCSYSESGGAMKWLGCTCKENDEGNCTNFITWCAEQGDEVGGNSGAASCNPGG